jgi:hypothetical protein
MDYYNSQEVSLVIDPLTTASSLNQLTMTATNDNGNDKDRSRDGAGPTAAAPVRHQRSPVSRCGHASWTRNSFPDIRTYLRRLNIHKSRTIKLIVHATGTKGKDRRVACAKRYCANDNTAHHALPVRISDGYFKRRTWWANL